jgi:hypothetical protein
MAVSYPPACTVRYTQNHHDSYLKVQHISNLFEYIELVNLNMNECIKNSCSPHDERSPTEKNYAV